MNGKVRVLQCADSSTTRRRGALYWELSRQTVLWASLCAQRGGAATEVPVQRGCRGAVVRMLKLSVRRASDGSREGLALGRAEGSRVVVVTTWSAPGDTSEAAR